MNFSIPKKILLNSLGIVAKSVASKSPIPALSGIYFDLKEDGLTLIGSNLESSIKCFIPRVINGEEVINIKSTGATVINENYISEITRKIEEDTINFDMLDGNYIKISTTKSNFNLNCISADEYTKIDIHHSDQTIKFTKKELKEIINGTVFAISKNESRPILTGVYFNCTGNLITINATDSFRLSHKVFSHNDNVSSDFIIPGKVLLDLYNILSDAGEVVLHIFSNKVMFEFDNVLFQTKLLDGTYPQTQKLIPTEFSTELLVNARYLTNVIERASILSRDRTKNVVKFIVSDHAKIISNSPEIGKVEEDVELEFIIPGDFDISFSARYMKEAINALNCDEVIIKFNGDMKPFIITNPKDDTIIQLVLPVRTY